MPSPINNDVNNAVDPHRTAPKGLVPGLKHRLKTVAEALVAALSDQDTVRGTNPTNSTAPAVQNHGQAPRHNAIEANAPADIPATAQVSPKSAALKWLELQCKSLQEALENENADNRQNGLKTLYMVAKEFKAQVGEHQNGLSQAWPQDLQEDFDANINRIHAHFNGPDTANINLHEIKFLHAYLGYMQICLKSDHKQVAEKLKAIEALLHRRQAAPLQRVHSLPQEIGNASEQCRQTIGNLENASRELDTHVQDNPGNNLSSDNRTTRTNLIASKRLAIQRLTAAQESLQLLVTEQAQITAQSSINDANVLREASNALNGAQARNAVPGTHQVAPAVAQPDTAAQQQLVQGLSEEITQLNQASTKASVLHLNLPHDADLQRADTITHAVTRELVHQFNEVLVLGANSKNAKSGWVKAAIDVKNQLDLYMANPATHTIRIPEESLNHLKSQFPSLAEASHRIDNNYPVYWHAVKGVSDTPETLVNANDKKLALLLLGSWAAQKSAVKGNDHGETQSRTVQVMRGAANLLGSSLTDKFLTPQAGEVWSQTTKTKINQDVEMRGLEFVSAELRKLPVNATHREYIDAYLKSTAIHTSESLINSRRNSRELIDLAKTDRTYLKDRANSILMEEGLSRQGVFKDTMIRAIDMMRRKPMGRLTPREDDESRMSNINQKAQDKASPEVILARLGLGEHPTEVTCDELLDQLVMASTVQNDFSTNQVHEYRGSFYNRIKRYQANNNLENMKNHSLAEYSVLFDQLAIAAYDIRPAVTEAINTTIATLDNNLPIPAEKVQRLVKQVLITTDATSALHNNFDLQALLKSSEALTKENSAANRTAFKNTLQNTVRAWTSVDNTLREQDPQAEGVRPSYDAWRKACNTTDSRSWMSTILRANPFRTLPLVNRIPALGKISYASFNLAKYLAAAGAGIGIAMPLVVGSAVLVAISAPAIYLGHKAVKSTMRQ